MHKTYTKNVLKNLKMIKSWLSYGRFAPTVSLSYSLHCRLAAWTVQSAITPFLIVCCGCWEHKRRHRKADHAMSSYWVAPDVCIQESNKSHIKSIPYKANEKLIHSRTSMSLCLYPPPLCIVFSLLYLYLFQSRSFGPRTKIQRKAACLLSGLSSSISATKLHCHILKCDK